MGRIRDWASFDGTNGAAPQAGVVFGNDGDFYRTTWGTHTLGSRTVEKPIWAERQSAHG